MSSNVNFGKGVQNGHRGEAIASNYLSLLGYSVDDVSSDCLPYDLLAQLGMRSFTYEVKNQKCVFYGDITLEIKQELTNTPGWFAKEYEKDYLTDVDNYMFVSGDVYAYSYGYVFRSDELFKLYTLLKEKNKLNYYIANKDDNPCLVVKIKEKDIRNYGTFSFFRCTYQGKETLVNEFFYKDGELVDESTDYIAN